MGQIKSLNDRLSRARELLLNGDIDASDYKTIKADCEHKIEVSEIKLTELLAKKKSVIDIEPLVKPAVDRLTDLCRIYYQSGTCEKQELIGSMYPEKFTFEELQHRTAKVGELFSFIYLINSKLEGKKEGQANDFSCLPFWLPRLDGIRTNLYKI